MERPLHWLKAQVHMEPTASSIENDKWPVSIDLTHHGRKGGKKAPHRIAGEVGGTDLCSGVRHLKILCDNNRDEQIAEMDSLLRRTLPRFCSIAWFCLSRSLCLGTPYPGVGVQRLYGCYWQAYS
jgi:hypothetical protein